ncbi:hypothetical protein BKA64DRAFT_674775 [Cadophora sp. MPI-SDFR-AT-0126]|nr:hypothetical protein BKA64DRAFT_674775 [Leotiomycetes sp. MPI-SDFR-AT-0126]
MSRVDRLIVLVLLGVLPFSSLATSTGVELRRVFVFLEGTARVLSLPRVLGSCYWLILGVGSQGTRKPRFPMRLTSAFRCMMHMSDALASSLPIGTFSYVSSLSRNASTMKTLEGEALWEGDLVLVFVRHRMKREESGRCIYRLSKVAVLHRIVWT